MDKPYAKGPYNKYDNKEQWIRISEGCPNNCPYCRETKENGVTPIYHPIPEIVRNKVKIMDMNLIYKPTSLAVINNLGNKRVNGKFVYYELIFGIDYRYMTQEISDSLKENRFQNIRLAWDYNFSNQKRIKSVVDMLKKSGYTYKDISVFMICNWKIPYTECMRKLDLLKIWRVKVNDCWFDNQKKGKVLPIHWTPEQIKDFGRRCRKHNQMVLFGIDPEVK